MSEKSIRSLAGHLSAVINHPLAPAELVNRIVEAVGEIEARVSNNHSAEFLFAVLRENMKVGKKTAGREAR